MDAGKEDVSRCVGQEREDARPERECGVFKKLYLRVYGSKRTVTEVLEDK